MYLNAYEKELRKLHNNYIFKRDDWTVETNSSFHSSSLSDRFYTSETLSSIQNVLNSSY